MEIKLQMSTPTTQHNPYFGGAFLGLAGISLDLAELSSNLAGFPLYLAGLLLGLAELTGDLAGSLYMSRN